MQWTNKSLMTSVFDQLKFANDIPAFITYQSQQKLDFLDGLFYPPSQSPQQIESKRSQNAVVAATVMCSHSLLNWNTRNTHLCSLRFKCWWWNLLWVSNSSFVPQQQLAVWYLRYNLIITAARQSLIVSHFNFRSRVSHLCLVISSWSG